MIDAKPFGTADEAKAERDAALAGYKDAEDKLASIDNEQATPAKQDITRAARAMLATTQYARSQFLARIGDTAAADQARKTAIDTIKQIKEENWPLPAVMAPELAEADRRHADHPHDPSGRSTTGPDNRPHDGTDDQRSPADRPPPRRVRRPRPPNEPNPTAPPTAAPDAATAPPTAAPSPTAPPPAVQPDRAAARDAPTTPPPPADVNK